MKKTSSMSFQTWFIYEWQAFATQCAMTYITDFVLSGKTINILLGAHSLSPCSVAKA